MNTNNGNRRTSLRLQSKLAKAKSINSSVSGNLSTSSSVHTASTTTSNSHKLDNTKSTTENVLNSANEDNQRSASMILRSNLLGSSTQEIKTKLYRLGKISDKKFKLKPRKNLKNSTSQSATSNSNKKRNRNKLTSKKREKKLKTWSSSVSTTSLLSASFTQAVNVQVSNIENEIEDARPATSASSTQMSSSTSQISSPSSDSLSSMPDSLVVDLLEASSLAQHSLPLEQNNLTTAAISNSLSINELKFQLKKATVKFNKACRQLTLLDQHMSDLQNSYSNAVENDRKTFKIVFRMQLATLEGTHNAYIEYIERQVEKIKKLKQLLFNDNTSSNNTNTINNNQNINNPTI